MNKTIEAFDKVRESATRLGESADRLVAHIDSMKAQHTPSQPVKQEHVCKRCSGLGIVPIGDGYSVDPCPDCAAPVRTKDLTDDEIDAIDNANWENDHKTWDIKKFARAVIAADRSKNNANNNT